MVCPACKFDGGRRSRRRTPIDFILSVLGIVPWRCPNCETRFHARRPGERKVRYARCAICGNQELQKIAPDYVEGPLAFFARALGLPALRCDPCRHKFFAVRPVLRECPRHPSSRDEAA